MQNQSRETKHLQQYQLHAFCNSYKKGLVRELNPGPLAPKARIIPLDQQAIHSKPNVNLPSQYIAL